MNNANIGEVKILSWQDSGQNLAVKALTEILLPALQGKNVEISVPHNHLAQPRETEDFQIFIWSSRKGNATVKPPQKIWGYDVACRDNAFPGTGEGIAFFDKSTGYIVAELLGDNVLYVHHDILHHGYESEEKIFRHLLEWVAEEIKKLTPEEKLAREKKRAEEMKNASRETFVKACSQRFDKLLAGTQKTIEDGYKTIQKLQIELTTKVREVKGAEQKLVQLEKSRPDAEEGYRKEFEKFLSVPDIKKIEAGDGVIKVFTNMIFITHERVKYQIGEFRIEIFINGGLKFFNLTNGGKGPGDTQPSGFDGSTSYNRHHPHVQGDGTPCLGTISSAVPQLIGEYQYSVVAILAIQYLKSVNADDSAGKGIYWWPKAVDEKN